jgi:hypothetical protein
MFKSGMIVKEQLTGTIIEVESVVHAGGGWYSITGIKMTKGLKPDGRKWSKRESIIHSPSNPAEVIG